MADGKTTSSLSFPNMGQMKSMSQRSDIFFALGIVFIIFILIIPIPSWLMDGLLAISITLSILILMTTLFINKPLEMNSFPTILLISTMLRLSLNIASTRLILANGHTGSAAAGHVIEAFGSFVMQGELVIGVIVFSILTIINFVVITKGAGRIAEVSARFSLDSMPGKQMAVDADLSAGLIDEATAKMRRIELEQESSFFGAMDGASKFVRGDAVAGLLILFINFIGGVLIGVIKRDMDFASALHTYTLLTIGDGLVAQMPALIVSIAAGILVTKSGISGTAERAVLGQLSNHPKAFGLSSGLALFVGMMPGMPFFPFVMLGGLTAFLAWNSMKIQKEAAKSGGAAKAGQPGAPALTDGSAEGKPAEESISDTLHIDAIRLELGYGLLPLINYQKGHRLTEQIKSLRKQMAKEMGFVMPPVRIQDNMQLPSSTYVVKIKDIECNRGEVRTDMLLVMDPRGGKIMLPGEETREPTFGLQAMWVAENYREEALFKNYTVVDPPTVITTHITEIIKENMAELLSYSETQKLLDEIGKEHQKLIADAIPNTITIGGVQRVLQNLLSELISIRDLPTILEAVAEAAKITQNLTAITEHVRGRLARQISNLSKNSDGIIPIISLAAKWEQSFAEALTGQGDDVQLSMAPSKIQEFISIVRHQFDQAALQGELPVLLTSPTIRPYVRSIIERFRPSIVVLSQNEIHAKAKIKTVSQI